jgi:hypothetical protein
MAHKMNSIDLQRGVEIAWHKLTDIQSAETLWKEGFGFEYQKLPMFFGDDFAKAECYAIGASDLPNVMLGKPQFDSFDFLSNSRMLEIVHNSFAGTKAEIVSVGTFMGRTKRYISVKLNEGGCDSFKVGDREFLTHLNLMDAIDGSMKFISKTNVHCVVCANTFNAALNALNSDFELALRHTKTHCDETKIENIEKAISAHCGMNKLLKQLMESAEEVKVSPKQAERAFAGFLGKGEVLTTRTENRIDRLNTLFTSGKGNRGATGLDVISSITDFYSHESSGSRGEFAQFESSEVGSGARSKDEFINRVSRRQVDAGKLVSLCWDRASFDNLCSMGEKSLSLS